MGGINKVIRTLIISDFFLQAGWGLIGPIFAVFIIGQIRGGSLATMGFIAATYWITKSIAQPFIAHFLDIKKGEKDDFGFLVAGMYVANLIPIGYLFSTQISQIFILEFIRGLAMAFVVPTWAAIFTRHIDKGWEAFSWSIESTSVGLSFGFAAAFGAMLAVILGFSSVFVLVSFFGIVSTTILFLIRKNIFSEEHFAPRLPPSEKPF
ncbi:MAG: MFS transporter [Parcubacteria group bacterium]